MVGSSASIADPNIVLNTIVAETLCQAADILEKADDFWICQYRCSIYCILDVWKATAGSFLYPCI